MGNIQPPAPIGRLETVDGGGRVNRLLALEVYFHKKGVGRAPLRPDRSVLWRVLRFFHLAS